MVKFLLESGAYPKLPVEHEWAQPLTVAKKLGHDETVKLLEAKG